MEGAYLTVATVARLSGPDFGKATYRVVYSRLPRAPRSQPAKTTRTVVADYETIQNRILARGW